MPTLDSVQVRCRYLQKTPVEPALRRRLVQEAGEPLPRFAPLLPDGPRWLGVRLVVSGGPLPPSSAGSATARGRTP